MNKRLTVVFFAAFMVIISACNAAEKTTAAESRIQLKNDAQAGVLSVLIDGRKALDYQYAGTWDLPHYHPLNSPSGRNMLVQKTNPYPHHRSFWFADKVALGDGEPIGFYNALYSGTKNEQGDYLPPFRHRIRHVRFDKLETRGDRAEIEKTLVWEMDHDTPVLDEHRRLRIEKLADGQYFIDITFTLTAGYGDVHFRSDSVHYAWPYLRMNDQFNGASGGVIANDLGQTGQKGTNNKPARWVDYSKCFDDATEGLTIFSHPDNGHPHKWLTREYGTFGPRRVDARSGKPFTLKRGEKLSQRIGIYVHRGDVKAGKVAEYYKQYIDNTAR